MVPVRQWPLVAAANAAAPRRPPLPLVTVGIELETDTPDTKYFMLTASGDVERAREERRRDEQRRAATRRAATRQRGESEAGAAKLDFCSSAGTGTSSTSAPGVSKIHDGTSHARARFPEVLGGHLTLRRLREMRMHVLAFMKC